MPACVARARYFPSGAFVSHGPVNPSPFPAWQWQSMIIGALPLGAEAYFHAPALGLPFFAASTPILLGSVPQSPALDRRPHREALRAQIGRQKTCDLERTA